LLSQTRETEDVSETQTLEIEESLFRAMLNHVPSDALTKIANKLFQLTEVPKNKPEKINTIVETLKKSSQIMDENLKTEMIDETPEDEDLDALEYWNAGKKAWEKRSDELTKNLPKGTWIAIDGNGKYVTATSEDALDIQIEKAEMFSPFMELIGEEMPVIDMDAVSITK